MSEELFRTKENKDNIIDRAEEIYDMFTNEYWQLDPQIAHALKLSIVMSSMEKGKTKTDSVDTTLMNMFAIYYNMYETSRGGYGASYSAAKLIEIFNTAKLNNAIKKTDGFWGKFKQLAEENSRMKSTIEQLTKEKDGYKRRYEDCENAKLREKTVTSVVEEMGKESD